MEILFGTRKIQARRKKYLVGGKEESSSQSHVNGVFCGLGGGGGKRNKGGKKHWEMQIGDVVSSFVPSKSPGEGDGGSIERRQLKREMQGGACSMLPSLRAAHRSRAHLVGAYWESSSGNKMG